MVGLVGLVGLRRLNIWIWISEGLRTFSGRDLFHPLTHHDRGHKYNTMEAANTSFFTPLPPTYWIASIEYLEHNLKVPRGAGCVRAILDVCHTKRSFLVRVHRRSYIYSHARTHTHVHTPTHPHTHAPQAHTSHSRLLTLSSLCFRSSSTRMQLQQPVVSSYRVKHCNCSSKDVTLSHSDQKFITR